jgi:hypothetical protein
MPLVMGASSSSPTDDCTVIAVSGGKQGRVEGVGSHALFAFPHGIAYHFDRETNTGQLFVADSINREFRAIDLKTGLSATLHFCFMLYLVVATCRYEPIRCWLGRERLRRFERRSEQVLRTACSVR